MGEPNLCLNLLGCFCFFFKSFETKQHNCWVYFAFKKKRGLVLYIHTSTMKVFLGFFEQAVTRMFNFRNDAL